MRIPLAFYNNLMIGKAPMVYCIIETHLIQRTYAIHELGGVFSALGLLADGSILADGSALAGSQSVGGGEKAGRVLDFGDFSRTIETISSDLLSSFSLKQKQNISIQMDNTDYYFTKMLAKEPFLSRPIDIYLGYEELPPNDHFRIFHGVISEISIDVSSITFLAEEA